MHVFVATVFSYSRCLPQSRVASPWIRKLLSVHNRYVIFFLALSFPCSSRLFVCSLNTQKLRNSLSYSYFFFTFLLTSVVLIGVVVAVIIVCIIFLTADFALVAKIIIASCSNVNVAVENGAGVTSNTVVAMVTKAMARFPSILDLSVTSLSSPSSMDIICIYYCKLFDNIPHSKLLNTLPINKAVLTIKPYINHNVSKLKKNIINKQKEKKEKTCIEKLIFQEDLCPLLPISDPTRNIVKYS